MYYDRFNTMDIVWNYDMFFYEIIDSGLLLLPITAILLFISNCWVS